MAGADLPDAPAQAEQLTPDLPAPAALTVIHADDTLLVLDKPAGLLAVPGRGPDKQDCLSARAQARWPDALIVHRLDMATSGVVVMARGLAAQRTLSNAFEKRRVHKRYMAVVAGEPTEASTEDGWQTIDLPLAVDWLNRPRSIVSTLLGKPSVTRWRRSATQSPPLRTGLATRLELEPVTGRTHQLRVHLQAIGHPIVGDPLYATPAQQAMAPRLLLHATELKLDHPVTGLPMTFTSACPF
ncbi:tRNA pseudouridine32 synthase/23S rRNA pseudouridine746 synthase [Hydrogenophaga palleronii]|uniref:Dual-specificity RNA pseudouridine synthase RluA n=1 Tax=Hydrogenophaga palleronii TaxID=65655 RepID=A0ABU1WFN5_9BURK|nr:RluA family pseudouridine synthase [Hydrogenophaga palleronii]MDR7148080.1 tRNA pseudouridine32 synthase/23S rRNA pseudouridine746 synthase [Hydrogenophaga palleronii]